MRLIYATLLFFALAGSSLANAQVGTTYLFDEDATYGNGFLQSPATQAAVVARNGCGVQSIVGRRAYLVKTGTVYWGVNSECVRVVVNHRSVDDSDNPTYLGVQIIGFYNDPQPVSLVLRRKGTFVRENVALPQFDDKSFAADEFDQDAWDSLHTSGTLEVLDSKVGTWHGTPQGGIHNSWDDRYWFRTGRGYDAQLQVKYKTLDNRLIRFTPYPKNGSPQDGPVGFDVNRRGARAVVIRIFSPSNADFDRSFVLVYEADPVKVAAIVNTQVVQNKLWQFLNRW